MAVLDDRADWWGSTVLPSVPPISQAATSQPVCLSLLPLLVSASCFVRESSLARLRYRLTALGFGLTLLSLLAKCSQA